MGEHPINVSMKELTEIGPHFLVHEHNYKKVVGRNTVTYKSESLIVTISHNKRDGFSAYATFPKMGTGEISLDTVLRSLEEDNSRGTFPSGKLKREIAFLRSNLGKLENIPKQIYADCCALRFWHDVSYRGVWGTTIVMGAQSILEEKARLKRIQDYFTKFT